MTQFQILPKCFPSDYIYVNFLPVIMGRVLNAVCSLKFQLLLVFIIKKSKIPYNKMKNLSIFVFNIYIIIIYLLKESRLLFSY